MGQVALELPYARPLPKRPVFLPQKQTPEDTTGLEPADVQALELLALGGGAATVSRSWLVGGGAKRTHGRIFARAAARRGDAPLLQCSVNLIA